MMSETVKIYQWSIEKFSSYNTFVVKKKIIYSIERPKTYKAVKGCYANYITTFSKDNLDGFYEYFSGITYTSLVDDDELAREKLVDRFCELYSEKITKLEREVESLYKDLNILRTEEIEVKNV